jgi:hypothetical protein
MLASCDDVFQGCVTHLLHEQTVQLLSAICQSLPVCRVHHPDESVCLLEVILPVCPQCLLAANIPYQRLVLHKWRLPRESSQMFSL